MVLQLRNKTRRRRKNRKLKRENKTRDWEVYQNAVERGGVAVMMSNNLYKHLEYIEPAGSRMMRIRFKFHNKN